MEKKSVTVISLVLTLMIMFMFTGSAFAYHPTIGVNTTKNGQTILQFLTKNGLQVNFNVAENGTVVERYRQIIRQVKDDKRYFNYPRKGLAILSVQIMPKKNKLFFGVFKRFGNHADGVIYVHHRHKKVNIFIAKLFLKNGDDHVKSNRSFSLPEIQNLAFKFNYPQPQLGNFSSKLITFAEVPGKNQYNIVFSAVDGLEYSISISANAKQILISIITNKLKTNLFAISLNESHSTIELMNPNNKKKKGEIAFVYENSAKPMIHIIGHNNINFYHNFK